MLLNPFPSAISNAVWFLPMRDALGDVFKVLSALLSNNLKSLTMSSFAAPHGIVERCVTAHTVATTFGFRFIFRALFLRTDIAAKPSLHFIQSSFCKARQSRPLMRYLVNPYQLHPSFTAA
jgi:hypothetical protein